MPLQKILFKPGVNRENTRYTTEGGWYDCDKIPGKVVGKLIIVADNSRKGFHWEVEPTMLEINPT